jgi:hypothetical protein
MKSDKFLIIDSRPYGLFSIFLHTIDNIKWAEENGLVPVVRWGNGRRDPNRGRASGDLTNFLTDKTPPSHGAFPGEKHCRCLYYHPEGYAGKMNLWEYYFEPLNSYTVEDALTSPHAVSDIFMVGQPDSEIGNKFLIADIRSYEPLVLWKYLNSKVVPKAVHLDSAEYFHRRKVNEIIDRYVTVRSYITEKVEKFYETHLKGHHVLSVHIRGTDKKMENPGKALPLEIYLQITSEYLEQNPEAKVYVASDNNEAIHRMIQHVGKEKVVVYPSVRMNRYRGNVPICLSPATGPRHGEECLIETLLLARGENLICTDSNVAAAAAYFNPEMTVQYLNRLFGV